MSSWSWSLWWSRGPLTALVAVALALGPVGGCVKRASPSAPAAEHYGSYDYDEYYSGEATSDTESGGGGRGGRADKKGAYGGTAAPPPPPPPPAQPGSPPTSAEPAPPTAERPAAQRMIHYDGWMRLRVADPRASIDEVIAIAEEVGGRTEQVAGNTVTIRVPVATFESTWERVLAVGDVIDRSIRADDVTEAFTAIDLRAKTLRATQQRLIELLGKAKDEEEKLRLLQEITRVSEELDAIESQLRTLSDLAAMSRISVQFVPREAFTRAGGRSELDGFGWIRALSPLRRAVWDDRHRVALPVPEGLVSLSPRGPFVAESPEGTVLWTMRVPNDPVGQATFWVSAIEERLADEFAEPTRRRLGGWECLGLVEPGAEEPYTWTVCVQTAGNKLHVAQVFYPGPAEVERYAPAIEASLTEAGGGT